MKEILEELNKEVGVIGCLVVTPDGMVVASALKPSLDQDAVAALASRMIHSVQQAMGLLGENKTDKFFVNSSYGRILFFDIEIAYLAVVTHQNIDIEQTLIAVKAAAYKITHRRA
jgi:predicted regulator of Ras-like GTPase activity (Roadblock/LC7/MglB family)